MIKITPSVYIKPLKRKGSDQGIPMPITEKKRATLALNWVMRFAKQKNQNVRPADLANLIILSLYDKGPVIAQKKKSYFVGRANRHLLRFYK
jgi:ribosomal protein S7